MSLVAMSLMAADYSQMTMEELNSLRGTIAAKERDAFKAQMQSRIQAMTPQERKKYRTDRGQGMGQKRKDGSGAGKIHRESRGQSQGIQQRLRDGSGAGSMKQDAGGKGKGHL